MLYRIERITDRFGQDRTDGRYPQRIGREGYIQQLEPGRPMAMFYAEPDVGTLVTTPVMSVWKTPRGLQVVTVHSAYHLADVEARDPEWPEPIDWEEDPE